MHPMAGPHKPDDEDMRPEELAAYARGLRRSALRDSDPAIVPTSDGRDAAAYHARPGAPPAANQRTIENGGVELSETLERELHEAQEAHKRAAVEITVPAAGKRGRKRMVLVAAAIGAVALVGIAALVEAGAAARAKSNARSAEPTQAPTATTATTTTPDTTTPDTPLAPAIAAAPAPTAATPDSAAAAPTAPEPPAAPPPLSSASHPRHGGHAHPSPAGHPSARGHDKTRAPAAPPDVLNQFE
jgi:hypothetical protein